MPFLGSTPPVNYKTLTKQTITGDSSTAYTLNEAVANANEIEVFVNNVRQQPTTDYTANNRTITFTDPLLSSDSCWLVYQGKAESTTIAQTSNIADGAITNAKISGVAASKLTGALPALDGSALTGIESLPDAIDVNASAPADSFNIASNGSITIKPNIAKATDTATTITQIGTNDASDPLALKFTARTGQGDGNYIAMDCAEGSSNRHFIIGYTGSERMRIDKDGKVGIGTSSPNNKLHLYDASAVAMTLQAGSNYTYVTNDGSYINLASSNGTTGKKLRVHNSAPDDALLMDASGRVGIGKSSSLEAPLEVRQTGTSQDGFIVTASNGSFSQRVLVFQSWSGSSFQLAQGRNSGGEVFRIENNGAVKNYTNSYGSLSDERVKQNIVDANSQWDDIKALQIKNYKLKKDVNADSDNAPTYLGLIAQDLEASGMNGLVDESKPEKEDVALHSDFGTVVIGTADNGATPIYDTDSDGNEIITGYKDIFTAGQNKKEVKYSVLYMKAVKALQEAMERIETLESKVEALENP